MKDQPSKIYLNIGFDPKAETDLHFKELDEVTWCAEKVNEWDLEYVSSEAAEQSIIQAKIDVLEEIMNEPSRRFLAGTITSKINSLKDQLKENGTK